MKNRFLIIFIYILTIASLFLINSCAGRQLKSISAPPPTSKLRVYVKAISAPFPYPSGSGKWDSFHKEFASRQISGIGRVLDKTGIYEVVNDQDVKAVLGEQTLSYIEMKQNNWRLAKEIGKAVFAEYVFVIERRMEKTGIGSGLDYYLTINLININSGKVFEANTRIDAFDRSSDYTMSLIIRELYRTVFLSAKSDMLGTAMNKSDKLYIQDKEIGVAAAPKPEPKITPPPPETKPQVPPKTPDITATAPESHKIPDAVQEDIEPKDSDINRLVIYDLDAPEQYKPVALILTEVLREELFLLNRFILVNRENMLDLLREMAIQQSGLIDEKTAVKAGKGLAANQVVTGSLGILGKTYLLQAKRTDVETFATLGIASARFAQGQEEDVLSRLPDLAKCLAGTQ